MLVGRVLYDAYRMQNVFRYEIVYFALAAFTSSPLRKDKSCNDCTSGRYEHASGIQEPAALSTAGFVRRSSRSCWSTGSCLCGNSHRGRDAGRQRGHRGSATSLIRLSITLADGHTSNRNVPGQAQGDQLLSDTHSHRVQIMLQAVKAGCTVRGGVGIQGLCEDRKHLGLGHRGHLPIVGVKLIAGPVHGDVAQLLEHKADTVVDITIGRTHVLEAQTCGVEDSLLGPLHLGNDLLIGQGRQGVVRPGVRSQVVTLSNLPLDNVGVRNHIGTDQEEGRCDFGLLQIVKQHRRISRWTIIKRQTPGVGTTTIDNIISMASVACPVASIVRADHKGKRMSEWTCSDRSPSAKKSDDYYQGWLLHTRL